METAAIAALAQVNTSVSPFAARLDRQPSICDLSKTFAATPASEHNVSIADGLAWLARDIAVYLEHSLVNRSTSRFDTEWAPYWSRIEYWNTARGRKPLLYATVYPLVFPFIAGLKCDPCGGATACLEDPKQLVPRLLVSQYDRDMAEQSAPGNVVRLISIGLDAKGLPSVVEEFRALFPGFVHHHLLNSWTEAKGVVERASWLDYIMVVVGYDAQEACIQASADLNVSKPLRVNVGAVYCAFHAPYGFRMPFPNSTATVEFVQNLAVLQDAALKFRLSGMKSGLLPVL